MHWIEVNQIKHNVTKNANILLNQHTKEIRDGEVFCSMCRCVCPCPTRILLLGYSELAQAISNMSINGEKDGSNREG